MPFTRTRTTTSSYGRKKTEDNAYSRIVRTFSNRPTTINEKPTASSSSSSEDDSVHTGSCSSRSPLRNEYEKSSSSHPITKQYPSSSSSSSSSSPKKDKSFGYFPSRILRSLSMRSEGGGGSNKKPARRAAAPIRRTPTTDTYASGTYSLPSYPRSRPRRHQESFSVSAALQAYEKATPSPSSSRITPPKIVKEEEQQQEENPFTPSIVTGLITIPDRCFHNRPQIKIILQDNSQIDRQAVTISSCVLQPSYICPGDKIRFSLAYCLPQPEKKDGVDNRRSNNKKASTFHEWYTLQVRVENADDGELLCFNHRVTRAIDNQGHPLRDINIPLIYTRPEEDDTAQESSVIDEDDEETLSDEETLNSNYLSRLRSNIPSEVEGGDSSVEVWMEQAERISCF